MRLYDVDTLYALMLPPDRAELALTTELLRMEYPTAHRGLLVIAAEDAAAAPYGRALGVVQVVDSVATDRGWQWQLRDAVRLREPWGMICQPHMWRLEDLCAEQIWSLL